MARLDLWNPDAGKAKQQAKPDRAEIARQRCDDLIARKRYLDRREEAKGGECAYCRAPTVREFCSFACETKAGLATLPIRFDTERKND